MKRCKFRGEGACWGSVSGDPARCYAHNAIPEGGRYIPESDRQYHEAAIRRRRMTRRKAEPVDDEIVIEEISPGGGS